MKPLIEAGPSLNAAEITRYARQLSLPGIEMAGQRRLRAARVLVIGAGGLGAPALQYLTAAGVGRITVIDDDVVELSNLQRQVVHRSVDRGRGKAVSARDALRRLDPAADVVAVAERFSIDNALALFGDHDLVIDGSDNFATRYLASDAAELTATPLIWGSIFRYQGQISVFWPGQGPMLRDLFPEIPSYGAVPSCAEDGVLGALCGTIGSMMASEAIKLICGIGEPLVGSILVYDSLLAQSNVFQYGKVIGREPVMELAQDYADDICQATDDLRDHFVPKVSVDELIRERCIGGLVILDVREAWEREIVTIDNDCWVPLQQIRDAGWAAITDELADAKEIILYCRQGNRSAEAMRLLASQVPSGYRLRSLDGGVLAWPGAPQY